MNSYKHSGTFGDTIYSLSAAKKLGPGEFNICLRNVEGIARKYGYNEKDIIPDHKGRYVEKDFDLLAPLIQRQPYITKVSVYDGAPVTHDLDDFRGVWGRGVWGNFNQVYAKTFKLPEPDPLEPWLECNPIREAAVVINRTTRYYRDTPDVTETWLKLMEMSDATKNGIFVGTEQEHKKFIADFGVEVPYRPVSNLLEMANLIGGADLFIGNQSSAYSIAVGLGSRTILEKRPGVTDPYNECYFDRGDLSHYF